MILTEEDYIAAKLAGKVGKSARYTDDGKDVIRTTMNYPEWKAAKEQSRKFKEVLESKFPHLKVGF